MNETSFLFFTVTVPCLAVGIVLVAMSLSKKKQPPTKTVFIDESSPPSSSSGGPSHQPLLRADQILYSVAAYQENRVLKWNHQWRNR